MSFLRASDEARPLLKPERAHSAVSVHNSSNYNYHQSDSYSQSCSQSHNQSHSKSRSNSNSNSYHEGYATATPTTQSRGSNYSSSGRVTRPTGSSLASSDGSGGGGGSDGRWSLTSLPPRTPKTPASFVMTPRSPFETGIPMIFSSSIPSPRPHRLSFAYTRHDRCRDLHVFFTLLMSVVGAGMLSVPYTFLLVPSWAAVTGIMAVGASMAATSCALLHAHVQLAKEEEAVMHVGAGRRFSSFQSIAIVAGGEAFGYLVSLVTAIGIFGGCVGCVRIVKDISPYLVSVLFTLAGRDATVVSSSGMATLASYLLWATFTVVVFPLCLLQNLSGLRISSYLGFAFSVYLVLAIVYRSLFALEPDMDMDPTPNGGLGDGVTGVTDPTDPTTIVTPTQTLAQSLPTLVAGSSLSRVAQAISIYNYAFMMQLNLIPLFIQLRGNFADPLPTSARKMTRCIMGVSVCCVALYTALGVYAKQLYASTVRGNILLNLEGDPVMAIPLVAVFLTVVLSFPLLFHPLRAVVEELVFTSHEPVLSFSTRVATTTVLLLSQLLLAIGVPGVEVVFAFTGATSCLLICFVIPSVLFLRLYPWRMLGRRGGLLIALLAIIVLCFTVIGARAVWALLLEQ